MIRLLYLLSCVGAASLYGIDPQHDEYQESWLSHFTSLIGQEMDTLERKVPPAMGQELASKLDPKATFREITTLLEAIRQANVGSHGN